MSGGECRAPAPWLDGVLEVLRPPPIQSLSEYLDAHYVLSDGTSASPGRWRTRSYQREIADAMGDPRVERVAVMKSSRTGFTLIACGWLMWIIDCDGAGSIMFMRPTVEDARLFSREYLRALVKDNERLHGKVADGRDKQAGQTILHKEYPGGVLALVGSNSAAGLSAVSRRYLIMDEVSRFAATAGQDGDPVKLAETRTSDFYNRQIVAISTPRIAGECRIEQMFLDGDQRRFHVPCPHCGHMDILVFQRKRSERGHFMMWPEDEPENAHFVCRKNGCIIEETHKLDMVDRGEWIADAPENADRSYHIWAAYSSSPSAGWGRIAADFLASKDSPEQLQVFVNTVLGETWEERGEAPEWHHLYARRQSYPVGSVPDGPLFLTAGVDVQHDRFVYEVAGWDPAKRSWSIDAGEIYCDTGKIENYRKLNALLDRQYPRGDGTTLSIARMAIDSGDGQGGRTQTIYSWVRRQEHGRVMACKGGVGYVLLAQPKKVDVTERGKLFRGGVRLWSIGTGVAKSELYGWLRLQQDGDGLPEGWCTFPAHPPEYFRQLTGEHLVTVVKRTGHKVREWRLRPGEQNHYLDTRILARAAASALGLDRAQHRNSSPTPAHQHELEPERAGARDEPRAAPPAQPRSPKRPWITRKPGGWLRRT